MKLIKNILEQFFNKEVFCSYVKMDKIFLKIFSIYADSLVFIKIQHKILFIGVKVPQLVAHFNSLKKCIITQFLAEQVEINDIKFFYYNKIIKNIKKEKINMETYITSQNNNFVDQSIYKKEAYFFIEKHCYKKEYHDILYALYVKAKSYEKK